MRMGKFRLDCERISYYFKWIFLLAKVQIRARVTFFVGGRFIDATENSTPVKKSFTLKNAANLWHFFLLPGKNKKKFSRFAIEFFPRQPWNVTNGFAFVSLLPTSEKWLAMFLRFFKRPRKVWNIFSPASQIAKLERQIFLIHWKTIFQSNPRVGGSK